MKRPQLCRGPCSRTGPFRPDNVGVRRLSRPWWPSSQGARETPTGTRLTWQTSAETAALWLSLYWVAAANRPFFAAALRGREATDPSAWALGAGMAVVIGAAHFLLLVAVAHRLTFKPWAAALSLATAVGAHYMERFGVFLDPSMLRNVVRSDVKEARELLSHALVMQVLWMAGLPLLALWRLRLTRRPWSRAVALRLGTAAVAVGLIVACVVALFQPLASLMRGQKELRYLITPANLVWSGGSVLLGDARGAVQARQAVGMDAAPGPTWADATRPTWLVIVVGETARRANWGLSGYTRQTTPGLAQLPGLINFAQVTACGTNTEVSVPCLFSPGGRHDYDESRIRSSESLLHVLAHAGFSVSWRDNQSGCKGVCAGLPSEQVHEFNPPGLCEGGRCLDEALLHGLEEKLAAARGHSVLVLHELGNHGPSYFRRYPPAFERFTPACRHDDLRRCSREEIVNAYDNALLYTDHVLTRLQALLSRHASKVDTAMVYVSDHGESLGENNLFLHGLPYAIAPDVQKQVPMVMWFSEGFARRAALDTACLARRAIEPAAHDHLFHTVLGLLDVRTTVYDPSWDLGTRCRSH